MSLLINGNDTCSIDSSQHEAHLQTM